MKKENIGKVLNIFTTTKEGKREQKNFITTNYKGIEKDKYQNKDPNRSILLTPKSSYTMALENNIPLKSGELGENILVDFNICCSDVGTKYEIGSTQLQISQEGTICKGLSKIDNKLPKLLKTQRGIFAKVIKPGKISINDEIFKL